MTSIVNAFAVLRMCSYAWKKPFRNTLNVVLSGFLRFWILVKWLFCLLPQFNHQLPQHADGFNAIAGASKRGADLMMVIKKIVKEAGVSRSTVSTVNAL
ncbi:MAG: hypothetical protein FWE27_07070 [Defluviitaleaceae bacterium]|nr:hypothetical protein [Defluviitaleaceae bacterium]